LKNYFAGSKVKNMNITILQIIIGSFGAIALLVAMCVMNKSQVPGFGPNNIKIFGSIIVLTFSGLLATLGGEALIAATAAIGTVIGFLGGKLDK
jgi:hypothetical protein